MKNKTLNIANKDIKYKKYIDKVYNARDNVIAFIKRLIKVK